MKKIFILIILITTIACQNNSKTEIYQTKRNNIINVNQLIHKINIDTIYFSNSSVPYIIGEYLAIKDTKSLESVIHLFNKNNFNYVLPFGNIGQSPNEITIPGELSWNEITREIYVQDGGKCEILAYKLDSLLINNRFSPIEKYHISNDNYPLQYIYANDTFSLCRVMAEIGYNKTTALTGKWNIKSGKIELFNNFHKEFKQNRFVLAVSYKDSIYAECNIWYDLISIADFNGNLISNIYGPDWDEEGLICFGNSLFTNKYLVCIYNGGKFEQNPIITTKCIVFNKNGEYISTFDVGYNIKNFCYDESNNRLIFTFDDEIQLGYLDLDEINLENK
ncbi:MAG: hypothetical protein MJ211_00805 [Bacteroidales bacterium]|nr:hypothetical protein [Bacteroidales bacterium]